MVVQYIRIVQTGVRFPPGPHNHAGFTASSKIMAQRKHFKSTRKSVGTGNSNPRDIRCPANAESIALGLRTPRSTHSIERAF